MNFKQLFCIHIWQDVKDVMLGKVRRKRSYGMFYNTYVRYSVTKQCRKCLKEKFKEREERIW